MIFELSVENIAVIERTQIQLKPGFTVLTGETGAGKSLLIDSIGLALGDRSDSGLVRTGHPSGVVSLVAELEPNVVTECRSLGVEVEEPQLVIRREVSAEGKSVCRLNGKVHPVSTLRKIGTLLVDMHGQHDHQALLIREQHVTYLDLCIGERLIPLQQEVARAFAERETLKRQLQSLLAGVRQREHRLDLLKFQIQEIEDAELQPGELEQLEVEIKRLQHTTNLVQVATTNLEILEDQEGAISEKLGQSTSQLRSALNLDPSLAAIVDSLEVAHIQIQDATRELRHYLDQLQADPDQLERQIEREDIVKRLIRKYGESCSEVLAYLEEIRAEYHQLQHLDISVEELTQKESEAHAALLKACESLTQVRTAEARVFGDRVQRELNELALEKSIFRCEVRPAEPSQLGADEIAFVFSANPGERPQELDKVASGGEASRVMLAIKTVLADRAGVPTLIFDEIDTGLSGRISAIVARKLKELSLHRQVIAISHLPQLAGLADHHFRIHKVESAGRVSTEVNLLNDEERVQELAKMLAGERIGENALANAREILALRSTAVLE